jgi:hypothetical protein
MPPVHLAHTCLFVTMRATEDDDRDASAREQAAR